MTKNTDEIRRTSRGLMGIPRPFFSMMAWAERTGRSTRAGQTAEDRKAHERGLAAFLSGDTTGWIKFVERTVQQRHPLLRSTYHLFSPIYQWLFAAIHPGIAAVAACFVNRGLLAPPGKSADSIYTRCLLPNLPKGFPGSLGQQELGKLWRNKNQRSKTAPCLASAAAIDESIYNDTNYSYKASDVVDHSHAAYAPLTDIFTCDKRSAQPLKQVIKRSGKDTIIIRSGRLDEVAGALDGG